MQMGMAEKNGLLMFIILCLIILIHSQFFSGNGVDHFDNTEARW